MIYLTPPDNFDLKLYIVSCFVEVKDKILLLHRQDHKPEGNTWGVPAGKVDNTEKPLDAMIRELREETSINITREKLTFFQKVYVRYPNKDFIYDIFHCKLELFPIIKIREKEHKDFQWLSPTAALNETLIQDLDACIKLYFKI